MHYRAILFDFDFTLVDSSEPHVQCFNHALVEIGRSEVSPEVACAGVGLPLTEMLVELAGEEWRTSGKSFSEAYWAQAEDVMVSHSRVLEATREMIVNLHGPRLGIVSSQQGRWIRQILSRNEITVFDPIIAAEDVTHYKPDPQGVLDAIETLDLPRELVLYVGDSIVDAQTARNAGVSFIGVLTGRTGQEELSRFPHVTILQSVAELPGFL